MFKFPKISILAYLILHIFISCDSNGDKRNSNSLFSEVSSDTTNINFVNQLTETEESNIIEYLYFYNGGGVAVGDINNDGLNDLYFSSNQLPNKLYLNKGNFVFEDITQTAGVTSEAPWKTGISMVDINGDGLLDIYVCRVGNYKSFKGRNELYINNGDLTFSEKAADYGLDFQGFSTQAAFFDYDRDGDLDMYLLNHAVHTEKSYGRASLRYIDGGFSGDRLYKNNHDNGVSKFTPVTNEAGIFSSNIGYGLGVGIADVNNDGWPDIYISNDFNENDYLYINQQDGSFKEQINEAIRYSSRFSMGNDLADINNDGLIDVMTVDMLPEDEITQKRSAGDDPYEIYQLKLNFGFGRQAARNMLQLNNGNGTFSEIGQLAGVHATDWSWAPLLADFDNDGFKDLFISNGILRRPNDMDYINFITSSAEIKNIKSNKITNLELAENMPSGETKNFFFKNKGDLTFENTRQNWGIDETNISNGAVYADLDNDGDLDLVVNHINKPVSILRNNIRETSEAGKNTFLKIRFQGSEQNSFGIGAKVIACSQNLKVTQENFTSRGFQSSVAPELHLGLGEISHLDSLVVIWPDGKSETIKQVITNQILSVKEQAATDVYNFTLKPKNTYFRPVQAEQMGLEFDHIENLYNDFNIEPLLPHKISREGPAFAKGDINGDGIEDLFIGGAENQPSSIFLQSLEGKFVKFNVPEIEADSLYEDVSAVFFDTNNNGHPDLYVVSAGNNVNQKSPQDRLYLNDGKGNYNKVENIKLPQTNGSVVLAHDYDKDGWTDLFIGGRVVTGKYGQLPKSYLLKNLGNGNFKDVTDVTAPGLSHAGMIKDAVFADLNKDGWSELILVGEWMPVTVYLNSNGILTDKSKDYNLHELSGWWNTVKAEDITGDGYPDLVVGNLGLNSRLKANKDNPVKMYLGDFYKNNIFYQIITHSVEGKSYPIASNEELTKNIPSLKKEFLKHEEFAGKTVEEIFNNFDLEKAKQFQVNELQSLVLLNEGGKSFTKKYLPLEAQRAPINAFLLEDVNNDGCLDLIAGGNKTEVSPYFGPYQGSYGLLMYGNCKGDFLSVHVSESGLNSLGDIRHIAPLTVGNDTYIIMVKNDAPLGVYKLNNNKLEIHKF